MEAEIHDVLKPIQANDKDDTWLKRNLIIQSVSIWGNDHGEEDGNNICKGTCLKFYLLKESINLKYDVKDNLQEHLTKYDKTT